MWSCKRLGRKIMVSKRATNSSRTGITKTRKKDRVVVGT